MKLYIKDGIVKPADQIIIYSYDEEFGEEMQTIYPTHEMIIADGWVEYVTPELTIFQLKELKINQIDSYDKSNNVNEFYVGDLSMWLSREERIVIKDRFTREAEAGKKSTKLRYEGLSLDLDPVAGIYMINELSAYADSCFDVTEDHKANVRLLETKEEIESYDYTIGYPDKLTFNL